MSEQVVKPTIFEFSDYRVYLSAYYDWQKSRGFFSHQVFADKAGLKSRGYLRLVLTGKRSLTPDSIARFIRGLELSGVEAEAFTSLVHFNQATDAEARTYYWDNFLKLRPKNRDSQKVRDVYAYMSRQAYPILLSILRQSGVDHSLSTYS